MKRKTTTLCMIARNEEACVGQAIKSAMALVDEIIVVDTGSEDNTRIIAEGYGARVVDLPWGDDFSAARNAGLAESRGEWILVLDADERLQPVRPVEFQRLLSAPRVAGYRVQIIPGHPEPSDHLRDRVRLFRNQAEIRYRYPIHEQIFPAVSDWGAGCGLTIAEAQLQVLNSRRDRSGTAEKRDRNMRILVRAVADYPQEPYFEYQLACGALVRLDEEILPVAGLQEALQNFERAWQKVLALPVATRRHLDYGADLVVKIAASQLARGRPREAQAILNAGRQVYGQRPLIRLHDVVAAVRVLQSRAVRRDTGEDTKLLVRARRDIHTLLRAPLTEPVDPALARACRLYPLRYLGELALLEGQVAKAAELFEKALIIDQSYSFAWLGLAECARYAGDRQRALKLYLRTVTEEERNHRAWLRGSSLLEELGFHDNAASWRRRVTLRFPEHPQCLDLGLEDEPALNPCRSAVS
jgi:tetratricopeptide (TPR) repeat protein